MNEFIPKPYTLYNVVKNYEWGTRNEAAFIPRFLGTQAEPGVPYAELWIGAHPKASSEIEINGGRTSFATVIDQYPTECLGAYVCKMFSRTFPFLLKVLSAANALSIQTHPNKHQAQQLHAKDPKNYPDENHKPEVAIALDSLDALVGFRPIQSIQENLRSLPELRELIGTELIDAVLNGRHSGHDESSVAKIYEAVLQHAEDRSGLAVCISGIRNRLETKKSRSPEEEQFLKQYTYFGNDVGLLSFFFFNLVHLNRGEALFTDAGIPHAYIQGNICECMANSDNVIRAGLTNKFKDVRTLLDVIRYEFKECPILPAETESGYTLYPTTAKEFEVSRYTSPGSFHKTFQTGGRPCIAVLIHGTIHVQWDFGGNIQHKAFSAGESFFIPASLDRYEISADQKLEFFAVTVP